jgi:hypothetical protein
MIEESGAPARCPGRCSIARDSTMNASGSSRRSGRQRSPTPGRRGGSRARSMPTRRCCRRVLSLAQRSRLRRGADHTHRWAPGGATAHCAHRASRLPAAPALVNADQLGPASSLRCDTEIYALGTYADGLPLTMARRLGAEPFTAERLETMGPCRLLRLPPPLHRANPARTFEHDQGGFGAAIRKTPRRPSPAASVRDTLIMPTSW